MYLGPVSRRGHMIRRICLHAGPGSGKSTLAARVFGELKVRGYDVEHVPEYIKTWAHAGRKPESYDQLYVFAKQLPCKLTPPCGTCSLS
jgi:hypothetical protein